MSRSYLIKECDKQLKEIWWNIADKYNNILKIAQIILVKDGMIIDQSVNICMRKVDAIECEKKYATIKVQEYIDWIDLEARNIFTKM